MKEQEMTKSYDNELYGHVLAIELLIGALVPSNASASLLADVTALVDAVAPDGVSPEAIEELKDAARKGLRRMLPQAKGGAI